MLHWKSLVVTKTERDVFRSPSVGLARRSERWVIVNLRRNFVVWTQLALFQLVAPWASRDYLLCGGPPTAVRSVLISANSPLIATPLERLIPAYGRRRDEGREPAEKVGVRRQKWGAEKSTKFL